MHPVQGHPTDWLNEEVTQMARYVGEMLREARNWADAHDPQDEETREALFQAHLAYLINELVEEAVQNG